MIGRRIWESFARVEQSYRTAGTRREAAETGSHFAKEASLAFVSHVVCDVAVTQCLVLSYFIVQSQSPNAAGIDCC